MNISSTVFGQTADGQEVTAYRLTNCHGNYVEIMDLGATITSILINGVDVALGYDKVSDYETNGGYLGACIGRIGNRIGKGAFTLEGKEYQVALNDGDNHLHGGIKGFDKYLFKADIQEDAIAFSRLSPDMEEGYPGNLNVTVTYSFSDDNELTLDYKAISDKTTIINLTNHTYFNLSGENDGSILDHTMQINATAFCEGDAGCLPTGKLIEVEGTPFDFRTPKLIGKDIALDNEQLKGAGGYDHNYALDGSGMQHVVTTSSPKTNIVMKVYTDKPGIQLYTGNALENQIGKTGSAYGKHAGLCLETQYYPDGINHPDFPSPILPANEEYHYTTTYSFAAEA